MRLEISANQLSLGAQGDDVVRVHRAIQALARSVPVSEANTRVLGPGTAAVVKALQQELNLPATGMVDAATVRAINALLEKLATDVRIVRGLVRDANLNTLANGFVRVFAQGLREELGLGTSPLNPTDGSYQVSYELPPESSGQVDIRVAVLNASGVIIETIPSGSSILTNAGPLEVVNFVLSGEAHQLSPEFDFLVDDLKPFLDGRDLAELIEDNTRRDVSLLASQSGYAPDLVASLVQAHKLAKGTTIPAPLFYGMLRQGLPVDATALYAVHSEERLKALKTSVEQNLVSKKIGDRQIEDYLSEFVPAPARELQGLLGRILNTDELNTFVGQYLKNSQNPEVFWKHVAADPVWSSRAADLKFTAQLGALTNNHVPLVAAVRALPDISQASDLARLTQDNWRALIHTEGVGVPADTPGTTSDEKTNNYVQQILAQVEAAFPTRFFAERLGTSRVATFLKAEPSVPSATHLSRTIPQAEPICC